MALRETRPPHGGPRAKIIALPWPGAMAWTKASKLFFLRAAHGQPTWLSASTAKETSRYLYTAFDFNLSKISRTLQLPRSLLWQTIWARNQHTTFAVHVYFWSKPNDTYYTRKKHYCTLQPNTHTHTRTRARAILSRRELKSRGELSVCVHDESQANYIQTVWRVDDWLGSSQHWGVQ